MITLTMRLQRDAQIYDHFYNCNVFVHFLHDNLAANAIIPSLSPTLRTAAKETISFRVNFKNCQILPKYGTKW
jgi:hypothetical protein